MHERGGCDWDFAEKLIAAIVSWRMKMSNMCLVLSVQEFLVLASAEVFSLVVLIPMHSAVHRPLCKSEKPSSLQHAGW
jgi:hypothetical protein